jgi:CheY-like chemotaxis protein
MKEPTDKEGRAFRILVIDDNRDVADSLVMLLEVWGYDARAVYHGTGALEAARNYGPDLIVSDIDLPGIDGYRLAQELRRTESFERTPLIAITATSDERRAKEAGFDHHLIKPANPDAVHQLLRDLRAMEKRLDRVESTTQQHGEVVTEVRDLVKEVKEDMKEIRQGLQAEVQELKQELREVKEDVKEIKQVLEEVKGDEAEGLCG